MPKVEIWADERYPDFGLTVLDENHKFGGTIVEISDEELAEYHRVNEIYGVMQMKLRSWNKSGRERPAEPKEEAEVN